MHALYLEAGSWRAMTYNFFSYLLTSQYDMAHMTLDICPRGVFDFSFKCFLFTTDGGSSCAYCTCIIVEGRSEVCVQHHLFTVNFHWICQVRCGDADLYFLVFLDHSVILIIRCVY